MKKLLLPAALMILSVSARAQVVAGAAAEAGAWVGPMAAAVTAAGSERISSLGFTSLTNLSSPDEKGRLPFVAEPLALAPLAQAVQAQGLTPQAFAALPTAEKLAVLSRAAVPAEAHAAAVADEALASVAEPVRIGTYRDASHKVANAADVSLYLDASRAAKLGEAVTAVKAYEAKRSELITAFLRDLPGKIAAGELNGANIIGRDADGWYAADEAPEQRYATVNELYRARLGRLSRGTLGPWTIRQTEILKAALRRPDIADAVTKEYWEEPQSRSGTTKLFEFLELHAERARNAYTDDPKTAATLARFGRGAANGSDVKRLEKLYARAVEMSRFGSTTMAWVSGTILAGSDGVPGWEAFKALKRETQRVYQRNAIRGMIATIAGMAVMILAGVSAMSVTAKLLASVAMFAPMAWMFVNIWRRDDYGFEADSIERYVNRGFDD